MKYFYCWVLSCDAVRQLLSDTQVLCVTRLIRCLVDGYGLLLVVKYFAVFCSVGIFGYERYVIELDF